MKKVGISNVGRAEEVQANHPMFDEHFSSTVIKTHKCPSIRIMCFIACFLDKNSNARQQIMDSLLCTRKCCQVVSKIDESCKSNKDIIKEHLCSDDTNLRKHAARLMYYMLCYGCEDTREMAKDILRGALEILGGEIPHLEDNELDNTIHIMAEFLSVEGRNIGEVVGDKDSVNHFIDLLDEMLRNKHLVNEITVFMRKLFTDGNANIVLNNGYFRFCFTSVLHRMLCADDTNLRNKAADILEKIFSEENIGIILKDKKNIMFWFETVLGKMFITENLGERAKTILNRLVENNVIDGIGKQSIKKCFQGNVVQ